MVDVDKSFASRFIETFIPYYIHIVLPLLVIFQLERLQTLLLWHATKQTKTPEDRISEQDNSIETTDSKRALAIKNAAKKSRFEAAPIAMLTVVVILVQQYLEYKSMEKSDTEDQSVSNYYLNLDINDLSWVDIMYGTALFFPTIGVINRMLNLLCGAWYKVALRDCDGKPFAVIKKPVNASPRLRRINVSVSVVVAIAAYWFRNTLAIILLNTAMVHLFSSAVPTTSMTIKPFLMLAITMFVCVGFLGGLTFMVSPFGTESAEPIELYKIFTTSEVNWAGLFFSTLLSSWSFTFISFCYRMDYHLSDSDSLLVGTPDVKGIINDAEDVNGTAVILKTEPAESTASSNKALIDFRKTYSNAALLGWLCGYATLAAVVAGGFLTCSWELSSVNASYFTAPIVAIFVFMSALVRGELRKVWAYKEDWGAAPSLEDGFEASENASEEAKEVQTEKQEPGILISVE